MTNAKRRHPSAIKHEPFESERVSMKDVGAGLDKPPRLKKWAIAVVVASALAIAGLVAYNKAHAQTSVVTLLSARTTTGGCTAVNASQFNPLRIFHANGSTSAGAGTAEIEIRGGVTAANVTTVLGTISLTLSTSATAAAGNGGFVSHANWPFVCANVNSISGTDASVNASIGAN